jgi:hypothetical protein
MTQNVPTAFDQLSIAVWRQNAPVGAPVTDMAPYEVQRSPAFNAIGGLAVSYDAVNDQIVLDGSASGNAGQANLTLANGLNSNVATDGSGFQRIGGPSSAYSLGGMVPSSGVIAGKPIVVSDTTGQSFSVVNEDLSSNPANRIRTPNGNTYTVGASGGKASCQLVYDSNIDRFVLTQNGAQLERVINVVEYGADPSGATDSTTAIQNALNVVSGRGLTAFLPANAVYFPPGTYKITSKLTVTGPSNGVRGIRLFGDTVGYGLGATVLQWHGAAHGTLFQASGLCHSTVADLVFDGNGTAGIAFWARSDQPGGGSGWSGNKFTRCYFINAAGASSDDGAYSACFRLGAVADGERQIDTTTFEFCYFIGYTLPQTNYTLLGLEGNNQKNYRFYNCTFLDGVETIKLSISGYNLFDTCTVSNFTVLGYNFFDGPGQFEIIGGSTENNWVTLGAAAAPKFLSVGQFASGAIRGSYIINQMCDANGLPSAGNPNSLQISAQSLILENTTIDGTLNGGGAIGACSAIQVVAAIGVGNARGTGLVSRNNVFIAGDCAPVTATGTSPPVITFTGTPSQTQTLSTTPYVEIDCTTGGAITSWQFTWKLNGVTQATGVASAATVALTGSGLTANISAGNATNDDVWKTNRRPSHIQVFVGANTCLDFTSTTENALANAIKSSGDLIVGPHDTVVCKTLKGDADQNARQALASSSQTAGVVVNYRGEGRTCVDEYQVDYTVLKKVSQNVCLGSVNARQSILRVVAEVVAGLAGGTLSAATCVLGKNSPGDTSYLTSFDAFTTGTIKSNFAIAADDTTWKNGGATVYAQFGFTGDARTNLTAGKVKFYVTSEFVGE